MDYNLFKKTILASLPSFLHEPYKGYKLEINSVRKVNHTIEALQLVPEFSKKKKVIIGPSLDLQALYAYYQQEEEINTVLREAAQSIEESYAELDSSMIFPDPETMKENIIVTLMNTQKNEDLLEDAPHIEFLDLSIVYRWVTQRHEDGLYIATVTYDMMKRMGLTEAELAEIAWRNTMENFPCNWSRWMGSFMYIITNEMNLNGAVGLLCTDLLSEIADKVESDLYVLPSSIHEVMVVAKDMQDLRVMKRCLREGNKTVVTEGEILSSNIYVFERDIKRLKIAED